MLDIQIQKKLQGVHGEMQLCVNTLIQEGEFIALLGKSGSGKTSLLRVLAGLEDADGTIELDGKDWMSLPIQKREIGFVFQDAALFSHMSVEENLLFVSSDRALAAELLEMTELTALAQQNVQKLSGGQKQRVNLCRAMMKKPKLLLMDEPMSALDKAMREKLSKEIKVLHEKFQTTTIMVTHDRADVVALATRVITLEEGQVLSDEPISSFLDSYTNTAKVIEIEGTRARVLVGDSLLMLEVHSDIQVGDEIVLSIK